MKTIKTQLIHKIASTVLGNKNLESLLCNLASIPLLRETLKLKVIPISYSNILNQPEIRVAQIGDYKLYVNISEPSGICLYFFRYHYEPYAAQVVSNLIRTNDVCVDIGANIGSYTFTMANRVGSGGKVFSFEPQPNLNRLLKDSIQLNKAENFIWADSRAIWKLSGETLEFYLSQDPHNSGLASLVNHGFHISSDVCTKVKTVTLTDFFQEQDIQHCRLLKIDVERAEFEVLQGMKSLLEKNRVDYILLEQLSGSDSQNLLTDVGYTGQLVDEASKNLREISSVASGTFGNYLFTSPEVT